MPITQVIRSFSRLTDTALETKATHIVQSLTGNETFPAPNPALATITSAIDNYSNALAKAGRGASKQNVLIKNQFRADLETLLGQLADYVDATAEGSEIALAGSGFDLPKKPAPVGPLPKPQNLKLAPGVNKGCLQVSVNAVPNARFYEFMVAESGLNGSTQWDTYTGSKKQLLISNLVSGKEYRVKVAAAGSDPARVWSDEATSFVL